KAELGVDRNPVPTLEVEPQRLDERVPLEAGAPDERVRLELLARLELHALRRDRLDHFAGRHLDAALREPLDGVVPELRLEHREDLRAGLDERDPGSILAAARVVLAELARVELRERPRGLDSRRPAADDDDVQGPVVDQRGILVGRLPETRALALPPNGVVVLV